MAHLPDYAAHRLVRTQSRLNANAADLSVGGVRVGCMDWTLSLQQKRLGILEEFLDLDQELD